jgi:hypothetical protein
MYDRIGVVGKTAILVVLGCIVILCAVVTADENGWINVTTEGKYSLMLPSGWTYTVLDSPDGKVETLINPNNLNTTYVIQLTDTQVEEGTTDAVAKLGLGLFMKSQNLTAIKDYDITYSEENGAATVICTDPQNSYYSIVFYPIEKKSILLMGNYGNETQAKDEIETLVEIVKTVALK